MGGRGIEGEGCAAWSRVCGAGGGEWEEEGRGRKRRRKGEEELKMWGSGGNGGPFVGARLLGGRKMGYELETKGWGEGTADKVKKEGAERKRDRDRKRDR